MTVEEVPPERVINNTNAVFTPCGSKGRTGPTLTDCNRIYGPNSFEKKMLVDVIKGVQRIRIPNTGLYMVHAEGARGGDAYLPSDSNNPNYYGGSGAVAWGLFELEEGQILNMVIGQPGNWRSSSGGSNWGGGGGGGTFVWKDGATTPLIVAGGGGGSSYYSTDSKYWGRPGEAASAGSLGYPTGGPGGTNGQGGISTNTHSTRGGAGAGWYSNGDCGTTQQSFCGLSRAQGFIGGINTYASGYVPQTVRGSKMSKPPFFICAFAFCSHRFFEGGFGGGGATQHEGGGGGGYSGNGHKLRRHVPFIKLHLWVSFRRRRRL